jgi:superfamily II DNA helicase RecQ
MIYGLSDVVTMSQMIAQSESADERKRVERQKLESLLAYAEATVAVAAAAGRVRRRLSRPVRPLRQLHRAAENLGRHGAGAKGTCRRCIAAVSVSVPATSSTSCAAIETERVLNSIIIGSPRSASAPTWTRSNGARCSASCLPPDCSRRMPKATARCG